MKYIGANFITTIKDWSCILIENGKLNGICLDKIDSFKFSPYLSDLVLYSIQSKREGKQSSIFPNLYEQDILKITEKSRDIFKQYFGIVNDYQSINFEEESIDDYKNNHAYYHVLGTHCSSPFKESIGICIDYLGYNDFGNHQVQTIWDCSGNYVKLIDNFDTTLTLDRGIGFAYSIFADFFDIYKYDIPYLVSYGNKSRFDGIELYEYKNDNVYLRRDFLEGINLHSDLLPKTFYAAIEEIDGSLDAIYLNIKKIFKITDIEISDAKKDLKKGVIADLMSYVQDETRKAVLFLAKKAYRLGNSKNLTVSGWLGSDHLLCRSLVKDSGFENFYFEISPNYTGISIGASFAVSKEKIYSEKTGYGKEYGNDFIKRELEKYLDYLNFELIENTEIQNDFIIEKIQDKNIIGYFKGGAELGPRALGNRSILSTCDCEDLGDRLRDIKKRQNWKSFSVSVLENDVGNYFEDNYKSVFMSLSSKLKDKYKKAFAGANFDNDIIRYQSVGKSNNKYLYDLLLKYKEKSGKGFLINTSLNSFKQSIVESPKQAIELFLSTDIDYLILGDFIVSKNKVFKEFSFDYKKLKIEKNIEYFEVNKKSYENYVSIKTILEKIVLNGYDFVISDIKYFERTIDLSFVGNKISIEKLEIGKNYDLKTNSIGIKILKLESKEDLIIFYKKLKLLDSKFKIIFEDGDYFLRDLINYL